MEGVASQGTLKTSRIPEKWRGSGISCGEKSMSKEQKYGEKVQWIRSEGYLLWEARDNIPSES